MKNFNQHLIKHDKTILDALKQLNSFKGTTLTLFVINAAGAMKGTVTDGDIRRALAAGTDLCGLVGDICNTKFTCVSSNSKNPVQEIRDMRGAGEISLLPVLDNKKNIVKVLDFNKRKNILPIDVVLMAGGRGERLRPITDKIPKPLIEVGGKTIIGRNVDRLICAGVENINISLNYKAEKIEAFFKRNKKDVNINFVLEKHPLGTMGAVGAVKNFKQDTVLIMNSDLFTNINFERFYLNFINSGAEMAVATVPYNVEIPYGIMEIENGAIKYFREKPSYTHYANAGIYLLKTSTIKKYLPKGKTDATDFVKILIENKRKVISLPLIGYWVDIGKPEDLKKVQVFAEHISEEAY